MATRRLVAALTAAAALALTGCATGSTTEEAETKSANTRADAKAFPVTIEHALGTTTIEEEPTRVAALGWSDRVVAEGAPHDVVTQDNVRAIFGFDSRVVTGPVSQTPLVVPIGRHHHKEQRWPPHSSTSCP